MVWGFARAAAALLGAAAILVQLNQTVAHAAARPTPWGSYLPTVIGNYFSYFTIQSHAITAIVLLAGAVWAWTVGRRATEEPAWLAVALACVTTYMATTGIVYNALLRAIPPEPGERVVWANEVMHVVIPLFLLLDLLIAPKRRALPWGAVGIIAAYPIAWVAYTLVRATVTTSPTTGALVWYPYPFLDPLEQGGWLGVILYIVGIAVAIIVMGLVVIAVGRFRAARRTARLDRAPVPA